MQLKRINIEPLFNLIEKRSSLHFNIQTQYKLLKIKSILSSELEIYRTQLLSLQQYFELDSNNNPIILEDGGIKIQEQYRNKVSELINSINSLEITLPDIKFELEELEPLELTFGEIELLEPFII